MDGKQLVEYACLRFEEEKYDEALEAFVLAYSKGYEREWVLENIYACYMVGNESSFREAYEKQGFDSGVSYEACALDFIPYKDGEYYIFDKACAEFCGKFSAVELERREPLEVLKHVEFSAAAVEFDGNWKQYQDLLSEAVKRKIYAVCHDMNRGMSYWKIPELGKYLENVWIFSDRDSMQRYFHENTAVYLPKIVYGENKELSDLLDQEHAYRLTPEGRNIDNVLLTIAIPTANRGYLLPKRMENLLKMSYDSEIEIAISKNCTRFYEEDYAKIAEIPDARVNYYDHGKELKYYKNWHYTVEMAHGKYVLFVADEDDVVLEALEHYFSLLTGRLDLSMLRTRTTFHYSALIEREFAQKGREAFLCVFLRENYLSGLIVRRKDFLQADLLKLDQYKDNAFYHFYPHEWWCAVLSQMGNVLFEPVELIAEGQSVLVEETKLYRQYGIIGEDQGTVGTSSLPLYSTYKSRLEQFLAQVEFIKIFCENDNEWKYKALKVVLSKLCYLFALARQYNYDEDNFENWVDRYAEETVRVIDDEVYEENVRTHFLLLIYEYCAQLLDLHKKLKNQTEDT